MSTAFDGKEVMTEDAPALGRRIVCLTTRFNTGGAELNALMLAKAFRQSGHDAEVWSLYRSGDLAVGGVPSRVLLSGAPTSPLLFARMVRNFWRARRDFKPDVILGFQPLANIFGALGQVGTGRFVASQRNPAQSQSGLVGRVEALLGSTKLYSGNIAVSQSVLDSYRKHSKAYFGRMEVIHNGLPPLPAIQDSKVQARRALGLPDHGSLVGVIGRLHHQKNQIFLVEVMRRLPEVHLVLCGDGPDEEKLRAAFRSMSSRVHFVGRVDGDDVTRAYRALDVFLFPSLYEGFGRSLIEAMSMRVPIIAHDLPITREVTGGLPSLIPLNAAEWASEIRRFLNGKSYDLDESAQRAESFSLDVMIGKYARHVCR